MGLLYDSSLMADEDCYELLLDGEPTGVVELPVEWVRDDAVYFMMHRFQSLRPQMPVEAVFDIFRREFDAAYEEGGICQITTHPHFIGYRSRIWIIEELIRHAKSRPGVWFATHARGRRLRQGARRLMRIAVVADIHGNVRALRAVMDDLKQVAPDRVVNLGDCVSGPLEAAETADVLISLAWTTVRGNHDRQLLDRPADQMGPSDAGGVRRAEEPPQGLALHAGRDRRVRGPAVLCHGTPDNDTTISARPSSRTAACGSRRRPRSSRRLAGEHAPIVLCGHSHMCRASCGSTDGRPVVNPGSVGLPAFTDAEPVAHSMRDGRAARTLRRARARARPPTRGGSRSASSPMTGTALPPRRRKGPRRLGALAQDGVRELSARPSPPISAPSRANPRRLACCERRDPVAVRDVHVGARLDQQPHDLGVHRPAVAQDHGLEQRGPAELVDVILVDRGRRAACAPLRVAVMRRRDQRGAAVAVGAFQVGAVGSVIFRISMRPSAPA